MFYFFVTRNKKDQFNMEATTPYKKEGVATLGGRSFSFVIFGSKMSKNTDICTHFR